MKKIFILVMAVISAASCSPMITTVLIDYRPFSQEGFLVTPDPYFGKYESLGEILISYPANMVDADQNNFKVIEPLTAVQQETSIETAEASKVNEGYTRYIYVSDGGKKRDTVLVSKDQRMDISARKPAVQSNNLSSPRKITPQDILGTIVKKAKGIGADAVTNFEFLVKHQGSTVISYEVSGYCIKRLD